MSSNKRDCNYCKTELLRFRKDENGNWHRYEDFECQIEHTYKRCKAVQASKSNYVAPAPEGQSVLPKNITNPPPTPAQQFDLKSLFAKQNSQEALLRVLIEKIDKLTKMVETNGSIQDSTAQNVTLLVEKVGYPEPKPAIDKEVAAAYAAAFPMKKEEKVIDPEKEDVESNSAFQQTQETIKKDLAQDKDKDKKQLGWQAISQKFNCYICKEMKWNGWELMGTKMCDECKAKTEKANEQRQHARTIEEINMQEEPYSF